jgi:hypothetical protein
MLCADIDGLKLSLSQKRLTCGHRAELVAYDAMSYTTNYAMTRSEDFRDPLGAGAAGSVVAGSGVSRM